VLSALTPAQQKDTAKLLSVLLLSFED